MMTLDASDRGLAVGAVHLESVRVVVEGSFTVLRLAVFSERKGLRDLFVAALGRLRSLRRYGIGG